MASPGTGSPIDDIGYLSRSEHRVQAIVSLADRARSRAELCELTGMSSSTIRRTLSEFEDRNWVRKEGYHFVATRLGTAVATGMEELIDLLETERELRRVWHWLPDELAVFPVERWSDLTVTLADPDAPYRPVNRFRSLLQETTTLRYVRPEVALMEPCLETLRSLIDDGATMTLIDRPSCHAYFLTTYPERSRELVERRTFTVLEHEDLPRCGIGLLDDRVTISCYEQDSGSVQALIETEAPPIHEWAATTFATYERDARPISVDASVQ